MASMEAAHYKLLQGKVQEVKESIDLCDKIIEEKPGLDSSIHASFYRVSADYYKVTRCTRCALTHRRKWHTLSTTITLSCISLPFLSISSLCRKNRIVRTNSPLAQSSEKGSTTLENWCVFFQLMSQLMHPILDALVGTPLEWLRTFLFQFNTGDMDGFDRTIKSKEFAKQVLQSLSYIQPLLVASLAFLRQKLCLMTLIEVVFKRSKESRGHMKFANVATETRIPVEEVEHLVMKALSLGLIKGYIDEVQQVVMVSSSFLEKKIHSSQVTWVQPRILDKAQIASLRDRLSDWSVKVEGQVKSLEMEGYKDVFVQ